MPQDRSLAALLKALKTKRMVVVFLLGFSSGLPIMLLYKVLKIWLREEGIALGTIGFIGWVTLPYSFKFLWSPIFDRFNPFRLGRRRSWLLLSQLGLTGGLFGMGLTDPSVSVPLVVAVATVVCFFSASQDIVVDAYRREILPDSELGVGSALAVYGYRIAMFIASGVGLWVVDPQTLGLTFQQMFFVMSAIMLVGILTTLWCVEPTLMGSPPRSIREAIIDPFLEFFKREGAWMVLLFILLFKMGDSMAGAMLGPFYIDVGFSKSEIATVTTGLGFFSSMFGLFLGGAVIYRLGYRVPLLAFGVLQALSTACFALLALTGKNILALSGVVFFEDFSSGMGTAALVGFMSSLTNRRFTATQYALLSSFTAFGHTFFSGFSGRLIEGMGYVGFFVFGALMAIPGLTLLLKIKWFQEEAD